MCKKTVKFCIIFLFTDYKQQDFPKGFSTAINKQTHQTTKVGEDYQYNLHKCTQLLKPIIHSPELKS